MFEGMVSLPDHVSDRQFFKFGFLRLGIKVVAFVPFNGISHEFWISRYRPTQSFISPKKCESDHTSSTVVEIQNKSGNHYLKVPFVGPPIVPGRVPHAEVQGPGPN